MKFFIIFIAVSGLLSAQPGVIRRTKPKQDQATLDFKAWEKINQNINSVHKQQRRAAVQEAIKFPSEKSFDLLRERLLIETDSEIADLILTVLESRKSRKDFFYVLDYLKIVSDEKLAVRSMKLLYGIHPPRLHYELNQLMKKERKEIILV